MRVSTTTILALPLLAAAAEGPFDQYKAQFQNFLGNFGIQLPGTQAPGAVPATENKFKNTKSSAKTREITTLTVDNWNSTLFAPVQPGATTPEEVWVMVSGRNKTCFGHCEKIDAAFLESASKFSGNAKAPHLAYLNCEDQPVLCNAWSASAGSLWVFEMLPKPAPIDIYRKRLNLTTTTVQTLTGYHTAGAKNTDGFKLHDGYFHPYDGPIAKFGLSIPVGYFFWVFNAIPSWAVMVGVSMLSRRMMSRNMAGAPGAPPAAGAAPAGAAPAGPRQYAQPGDARS